MSAIITSKSGNHTYIYESESYREDGKVKNRRRIIGKVDPATGNHIYKPEYLERKGLHTTEISAQNTPIYSVTDVKHSIVKEYGAFYLMNEVAKSIGLVDILRETLPCEYEEILNIAYFMVSTGEPAMYCEDWLYKTEGYETKDLSSQRISELLANITEGDRLGFFEKWGEFRCENEYVALDITSISSYSELINDAEWGYNRDGEKLPQVNVCLLLGEKSHLPIFQKVYSGSIGDISTLKSTLQTMSGLNLSNMSIVMDKGFSKVENINALLSDPLKFRFLIPLKFTTSFAKEQVNRERDAIDSAKNTIIIGEDVLRGITSCQAWSDEYNVFVHAIHNTEALAHAKNKLFATVQLLVDRVKQDPEKYRNNGDVKKYLTIRKTKAGYSLKIKENKLLSEMETTGWLILISNHIDNAQEALEIYRTKDVVEKGFWRMKTCLDLARLRVHSDKAMQSKIFIGFIALIICAHIHKVMSENNLYKSWSMKKMLKILERLKIHHIKSDHILSPLTKDQKRIFSAFGVSPDL